MSAADDLKAARAIIRSLSVVPNGDCTYALFAGLELFCTSLFLTYILDSGVQPYSMHGEPVRHDSGCGQKMMRLFANHTYPIGVDMGDDALTLVQMAKDIDSVRLHAANSIRYPADVKPGSASWQKWAIEATAESVAHGRFQGKKVIAAQPAGEVFIDTIKMSEPAEGELQNAILNHLKPKLQITPDNVLIKHVRNDSKNILVMASDRTELYRHLAIYEKARLKVGAISVWPMAVLRAYTHLWARHMGQDDPVMLLDIGQRCTNIVICDSANLYFAHSSPVGAKGLEIDRMIDLLNSEMDMCRVKFRSAYRNPQVNHIIFVSGHAVDKDIYAEIAKRAQMSAQIGDCLDAARIPRSDQAGLRSRAPHANWITAMGLSLSGIQSTRRYHTINISRRELTHC